MTDHGTPPSIPTEFQLYNSYEEDPKWQRKFSIIWAALVAGAVLYSFPHLLMSIRRSKAFVGFWGLREDWNSVNSPPRGRRDSPSRSSISPMNRLQGIFSMFRSMFLWTLPLLRWNLGQLIIVVGYLVIVLICLTSGAQLASNSNRAGFLAIAQLPPLYLFATKNSVLAFLLGPGTSYHTLNPIHRLIGFSMLLCAFIHGSLWISNHLTWNLPILSQQKEGSGVAALGCIGVIGVTSVRFIREGSIFRFFSNLPSIKARFPRLASVLENLAGLSYECFWVVHLLVSVAFFITVCYHTIYAPPWIFPPLAFLGADILMRMWRLKMKDALVWNFKGGMSVLRIPDVTSGWTAGQHVRLRVFFGGGRVFESHPLTIANASPDTSCSTLNLENGTGSEQNLLGVDESGPGILLGARVNGDWTKALNEYVKAERARLVAEAETTGNLDKGPWDHPVPMLVSIDGPYGGSSIDMGGYETALFVAGGSGATFTISLLDDLVGRIVRGRQGGEKTKRIEFVWCVKGFGCVSWFAPLLRSIALAAASTLDSSDPLHLHLSVYVTCLCSPQSLPEIPNMDVLMTPRPDVAKIIRMLIQGNDCMALKDKGIAKDELKDADSESIAETSRPRPISSASSYDRDLEKDVDFDIPTLIPCNLPHITLGGGIGICASGPESLTRETSNAVAMLGIRSGGKLGNVGIHTEVFQI